MKDDSQDAQVTAFVFGELDENERLAFEQALAASPELQQAVEETRSVLTVLESEFGDQPREALSEAQRTEVEQAIAQAAKVMPPPVTKSQSMSSAMSATDPKNAPTPLPRVRESRSRMWATIAIVEAAALAVGGVIVLANNSLAPRSTPSGTAMYVAADPASSAMEGAEEAGSAGGADETTDVSVVGKTAATNPRADTLEGSVQDKDHGGAAGDPAAPYAEGSGVASGEKKIDAQTASSPQDAPSATTSPATTSPGTRSNPAHAANPADLAASGSRAPRRNTSNSGGQQSAGDASHPGESNRQSGQRGGNGSAQPGNAGQAGAGQAGAGQAGSLAGAAYTGSTSGFRTQPYAPGQGQSGQGQSGQGQSGQGSGGQGAAGQGPGGQPLGDAKNFGGLATNGPAGPRPSAPPSSHAGGAPGGGGAALGGMGFVEGGGGRILGTGLGAPASGLPGDGRGYGLVPTTGVNGQPIVDGFASGNNLSIMGGGIGGGGMGGMGPGRGGDRFEPIVENEFLSPWDSPYSTFSIDVDTAAYSKMRMFLSRGQLPPPGAVRIEELINYFPYSYEPPSSDESAPPFAARMAVSECPWNAEHRIVRIGVKGKEMANDQRPASNLVFLLDVSGSMTSANKLPLLIRGMTMLVEQLNENDSVSIVVYAGKAGMVLEPTHGDDKQTILDSLTRLRAGGSTNGGAGIKLAYKTAVDHFIKDGVNRVILCTDGDFNVGVTGNDELVRLAESNAKDGVFLTVLGFGMGNHNDSMLEKVSNKGNGNYAFIDTELEARKVLVEQMSGTLVTIAKDVKIQVEFNPERVAAYRLIGYENRMLATEDFNDDTKDAGEIGAGHAVTALYEIVPKEAEKQPELSDVDALKYQRPRKLTKEAQTDELLTLKMRYKKPDEDVSTKLDFPLNNKVLKFGEVDPDFRFTAAVASFGMLLRGSKFAGDASFDAVLEIATEAAQDDEMGYRKEFLELVKRAKTLRP